MSHYLVYLWEDLDSKEFMELKFGDHFSMENSLEKAIEDTKKYIRNSFNRQKHKFDDGRIKIHQIWDVSNYAKNKGRFAKHKKIDDVIREFLPGHYVNDIHRGVDPEVFIESVNLELIKNGQALQELFLTPNQLYVILEVIDAESQGKQVFLLELCPRYGKTPWTGALIRESGVSLSIICSYVHTSFASFRKELTNFNQFKDFCLVDSSKDGWQEIVTDSLKNNKQTIVFLSLCQGKKRKERIDFLFGLECKRYLFVDEADYGSHAINQAKPLVEAVKENDVVFLMTGTDGDKAVSLWKIDHYISVTYPELLMEKHKHKFT